MGANPQNIWQVPAYLSYVQPPLTPEIVEAAERQIGYKLPQQYIELLKVQNGGYLRYRLPDSVHEVISGIGPHFPSLTDFSWDDDYFKEAVSFELQGLVPFDGDGHWYVCLDYRQNATQPAVTYIDVECDSQDTVASSFSDYLSLLELAIEDDEYAVAPVKDVKALLKHLTATLGVKFDKPNLVDYGYPTYLGRMQVRRKDEAMWLSPNDVPRGFVRPDDQRYDELRNSLPGEAKRFPELPSDSYLISATAGLYKQLVNACAQIDLELRPLKEYYR